jgi:hypothetical protein
MASALQIHPPSKVSQSEPFFAEVKRGETNARRERGLVCAAACGQTTRARRANTCSCLARRRVRQQRSALGGLIVRLLIDRVQSINHMLLFAGSRLDPYGIDVFVDVDGLGVGSP